jgi:hypothetical protein
VKPRWPLALVLDALSIVVFVVIGRASHHHGETAEGIASTLWPFATGGAVGWAALGVQSLRQPAARRASAGSIRSGVAVCVSTVAVGMVLRVVAGQGTAASFVAVATAFLGACMLGWRAVAAGVGRRLLRATRDSVRR